jgi:1,4-alpha-glucan branching enzyme
MSIKKQVLKTKPVAKVSFKVSKEKADGANTVAIIGDFNEWNPEADVMKALKDGSFSHTIELPTGVTYQFRYLADGQNWFDEEEADGYKNSGLGDSSNALIIL